MPYANEYIGIYKIENTITGQCYVGQSQWIKKRIHEHFRLLKKNLHPNPKLQHSYNKYGKKSFTWDIEVVCEDVDDLDSIENAFLTGSATFESPCFFNIANAAKVCMRGKKHTKETRELISKSKTGNVDHVTEEYRKKLSDSHQLAALANPEYRDKIKFIIDNDHLSYAERGRITGFDTSSTRKKYLTYSHMKGDL